mmetsp:Transcript_87246/g.182596  ORF Transcript_87246/g.182596 Transcript_87246/m.182596 type:complete len:267 (-) Transcript_87246:1724-2524(-)
MVETYSSSCAIDRSAKLDFFDDSGHRLCVPHPLNRREVPETVARYTEEVIKFGCVPGVRGQPCCVLSAGNKAPYQMISFAALAAAIYRAHDERPEEATVCATMTRGLENAVLLHHDLPRDCVEYLRDLHNSWRSGNAVLYTQILQEVDSMEAAWGLERMARGYTDRAGNGAGSSIGDLLWEFLQKNYPKKLQSANQYIRAKALPHILASKGWKSDFVKYAAAIADFTSPEGLSNQAVILNMHQVSLIIQQYDKSLIGSRFLKRGVL